MTLVTLRDISLSFSGPPLLDHLGLTISGGERTALIGRNGEGKSTLLKVIAEIIPADEGDRQVSQQTTISYLSQEVPTKLEGTVFEVVSQGLDEMSGLITDYHNASLRVAENPDEASLEVLSRVQQALEDADGWQFEQQVETVVSRLSLDADVLFDTLSGGLKRRVLLARELVRAPDLLILDEPTNHLDVESIRWLEEFLLNWKGSLLFVTHDRAFMQKLATGILELDRGQLTEWPGDYENYLRRRAERENAEAKENERLDKLLSQEEVWIRQGVKARRTRNEGRVRKLEALRERAKARRTTQGEAKIVLQEAERSGKLVAEAVDVSYNWGDNPVIRNFTTTIMRGDKIGVIGPNGCGKSTLLKLLLGDLNPDSGTLKLGTGLQVAYFDQLRSALDPEKSVQDNVGGGSDKVEVNGKSRHIISYLQDFLFSPQRSRQPVNALSGGERNRLLLAKLFTKPASMLVMDEPTNDLDIETLELLEELLIDFQGTVLLVSHDRAFIDNVVTSTLVFEGDGVVNEYVGGYEEWQRQYAAKKERENSVALKAAAVKVATATKTTPASNKLSYKDKRELEQLPKRIESLESELESVREALTDPALYKDAHDEVTSLTDRLQALEEELESTYSRWEELDG